MFLDQVDQEIDRDHSHIVSHGGRILQKEQIIALNVVRNMLSKSIYGYFHKWKISTEEY